MFNILEELGIRDSIIAIQRKVVTRLGNEKSRELTFEVERMLHVNKI